MKKCPVCNSSKYNESMVDGNPVKSCKNCGYLNKINNNIKNNVGQLSLDSDKKENNIVL